MNSSVEVRPAGALARLSIICIAAEVFFLIALAVML